MDNSTRLLCIAAFRNRQETMTRRAVVILLSLFLSCIYTAAKAQIVIQAAGPVPPAITFARDQFRFALGGGAVAGANGSFGGVRREINWDGVPDAFAAPNNLPANFFNVASPRGVVFSTPGTGFQVSANAGVAPIQFNNINPGYDFIFEPFSPQRLFTSLGSNITDVRFFVPGTNTPALTRGFGAVFSDVDHPNIASIQYFDQGNNLLGTFFAPASGGFATFSFLGVIYPSAIISRVRITAGTGPLTPTFTGDDIVVMDDFIYGEPVAISALVTWYRDFDGDGFGNPSSSMVAVSQPAGYVSNNLDCNDYRVYYQDNDNDGWGNATKLPCGTITRTGDCDDNNNKVHSLQTFYRDADGDSWGDAAVTTIVCSSVPPTGYVANRMDCNDADPTIRYCPPPVITRNGKQEASMDEQGTTSLSIHPNPVFGATRIQYWLPVAARISIKVYDILGREVGLIDAGEKVPGTYSANYNTEKLSSGLYYCRLVALINGRQVTQTQKLVKTE